MTSTPLAINTVREGRNVATSRRRSPGYAVGAINTHTGLLLDAFQFVFMRFENGKLDPNDCYSSSWLGDPRGGNPASASGGGKIVVGVHGRSNGREINALGLVFTE